MKSKRDSPSSGASRSSRTKTRGKPSPGHVPAWDVALLLLLISAAAIAFSWWKGWILYYGDAQAHLTIARRVLDSRTPGYEQFGTVWLPLPHALMLGWVWNDVLWRTGLAGAFASGLAFAAAGTFLFGAARRALGSEIAGWVAVLVLALNPNLLYLQSTPMTEAFLFACVTGVLYYTVRFGQTGSTWDAVLAGVMALAGTLTRYEGWFVLPFAAGFLVLRKRWQPVVWFCAIAGLGPLYWLAHNWWYYGNPLEFYNGYYSARQIYQRALDAGGFRYPGDGEWGKALLYFRTAAELCVGTPLLWVGLAGGLVAVARRAWWPVVLLATLPVFYVWSMHGSGTPVFVPSLWPNSYYNTRYGLSLLPLLAFGAAACATIPKLERAALLVVPAVVIPWLAYPNPNNWITWKEAQVNSAGRRAWTREAAEYLRPRYRAGAGLIMPLNDLSGVLRESRIPLREALHEGNGPRFESAIRRPDLFLWEEWGVCMHGDAVCAMLEKRLRGKPRYEMVRSYPRKSEPAVEIYRRLR